VKRVIKLVEDELRRAQAGETSEVLQLLIGRDSDVRFRLRPDIATEAAGANTGGPELTLLGTPGDGTETAES
jgi:hypothetical protein